MNEVKALLIVALIITLSALPFSYYADKRECSLQTFKFVCKK